MAKILDESIIPALKEKVEQELTKQIGDINSVLEAL